METTNITSGTITTYLNWSSNPEIRIFTDTKTVEIRDMSLKQVKDILKKLYGKDWENWTVKSIVEYLPQNTFPNPYVYPYTTNPYTPPYEVYCDGTNITSSTIEEKEITDYFDVMGYFRDSNGFLYKK